MSNTRHVVRAEDATVSAPYVRSILDALARMGVPEIELATKAGLSIAQLDAGERVPIALHHALWRAAEARTSDPHVGLHVGERVTFGRWGTLEYLLTSASSLRQAMARVERYWRLVSDDQKVIALVEGDATASIRFRSALCEEPAALEADMVYALRFVRQLADPMLVPRAVRFEHAPRGALDEYTRVFGVVPIFGAQTQSLDIAASLLDVRALGATPRASGWAEQEAEEELARIATDLGVRVRAAIARDLRAASLDAVAATLGTSARSLQRHLAKDGLAFRALLDEAKQRAALELLAHSELPLAEISYRLGFSDGSAFSQAARRWFEASPGEIRDARRPAPGPN